jgi:uncharacterized integral membrane protein
MMETNDNQDRGGAESGRSGPSPALIGFGIVAVVAVIFIIQNSNRVRTNFLFLELNGRLWLTILLAMVLGAVLDRLLQMWWRRRRSE